MGVNVGGADHTGAAAAYAISTGFSWAKAITVPWARAGANIILLKKQVDMSTEIARKQRHLVAAAVDNYNDSLAAAFDNFKDAYPDVPRAARYVPVNPTTEQRQTIQCNIDSIPEANDWALCVSRLHQQADLTRMVVFDPRWMVHMDRYSVSVTDLLRGKLPITDFFSPSTNGSEDACLMERIGMCYQTPTSVGLSRSRMHREGRDLMAAEVGMMEAVSPVNRQMDIRDLMQMPQQRIALALTQAQLIQNSLQNLYNQQAQKPPARMAHLMVRLERILNHLQLEASKANMVSTFVPNYAAILQPQISQLAEGFGAMMSPSVTQSSYNSPSVGGDYQQQNSAKATFL